MTILNNNTLTLAAAVAAALAPCAVLAQTDLVIPSDESVLIDDGVTSDSDIVADAVRAAGTDFIDEDTLSLKVDAELDFDAIDQEGDEDGDLDAGGRIRLTLDGAHFSGDRFIRGRAEALLKENGEGDVDDAWIAFGDSLWELQLGRFEGVNLFPLGLDTIIVHAPGTNVYENNIARGRIGESGGQIAVRVRPSDRVHFEVDGVWGDPSEGDNEGIGGIRPAVTFNPTGALAFTVGGEWVDYDTTTTDDDGNDVSTEIESVGYGGTLRYNAEPFLAHFNVARQERDDDADTKVTTFGANLIYGRALGLGVIHSITDASSGNEPEVTTGYVAYVMPLFGFNRAAVTFAGSYSVGDDTGSEDDETAAARVRFNYAF